MYSNTVIYSNDTLCDSVKRSISTYRDNFKNLSSELEKKVSQDEELKYFYSNISSECIKISLLDTVASDKVLQKRYSDDLKKFFNFYSNVLYDETVFLKNNSNIENIINILHSNNDKLQTRLKDIYMQFEAEFDRQSDRKFDSNDIVITLPEEDKNEVNRVDRFNFSNRISFQS
ncbi:MAG: hypothetical protein ACLT0S_10555 [Streptococcus sp.]|jgi:hypothetical protein|uniref:hypothetical protein n=1 Tax=Streptococcus sp. TaxID=1306 RepID=UPI003996B4A3